MSNCSHDILIVTELLDSKCTICGVLVDLNKFLVKNNRKEEIEAAAVELAEMNNKIIIDQNLLEEVNKIIQNLAWLGSNSPVVDHKLVLNDFQHKAYKIHQALLDVLDIK